MPTLPALSISSISYDVLAGWWKPCIQECFESDQKTLDGYIALEGRQTSISRNPAAYFVQSCAHQVEKYSKYLIFCWKSTV